MFPAKNPLESSDEAKNKKKKLNELTGFIFMTEKNLTFEEVALLLPSGYEYENNNLDLPAFTELQKYGSFTEKETLFFIKMCQTVNLQEKEIFQSLISILKDDRRKRKKSIKRLSQFSDFNMVVEKIILMLISQDLDLKCKERLILILENIYLVNYKDFVYWKEILFLMMKDLDNKELRNPTLNLVSQFFIYDIEKITDLIYQEIYTDDKFDQDVLSKLLALCVIFKGYSETLREFISPNLSSGILIFLRSHYFISSFIKVEVSDFKNDMLNFLLRVLENNQKRIRKEVTNVVSHLCLSGMLNEDCTILFEAFLKIFLQYCNVENPNLIREKLIIPNLEQEKTYLMHILRCCSILSINNQNSSLITFEILKKWSDFTINNIKIFYRICENLEYSTAVEFCLENFDNFFDTKFSDYKNMIISIFVILLPNAKLEEKLISNMMHKSLILEIFSKIERLEVENKEIFRENLYFLLKSNDEFCIQNVLHLGNIGNCSDEWYKFFELGKSKIDDIKDNTIFAGFKLINNLINKIEKRDLKKFGEILYEKLDKAKYEILARQLNTLSKIYCIVPFNNFTDLILEIAPILKIKDDLVKEKAILFLTEILKKKIDHNVKKTEFMRISYDVMDYLSFWYVKKKQCGIDLLIQISDYVPPQELINIYIDFLEFNDKNIKKGIISGISQLANYVGLYNVLPVLLVDYKYSDDKVKLIILRTIIKCKVSAMYIPNMIPIIEDAILCPDLDFRILGIELITELLVNIDEINSKIFTHFLNITWFNILDKNILLKKAFNKFIEEFTKVFGSQFLLKYVIQGLLHPSKTVKKRYSEIFEIISENDENTAEYISILNSELKPQ